MMESDDLMKRSLANPLFDNANLDDLPGIAARHNAAATSCRRITYVTVSA
ncbi:hypothetical protein H8A99_09370 [Bradyrhizobium sp. Arg68]|nr:hypothetical protein [Bradyrhizobium ivorense]MCC8936698.1 hypothetical protein [Bradyrhizobium ivorense]